VLETIKSRRLRQKQKFTHAIIKPHAGIPESVVIKDNLKVVTFLNPLSFQTQKRYKEVIRAFFSFYEGFKISDIESQHIENYLKSEFKNKSASTKAIHKSALSSLFKFLVKDRYITSDPTFALKRVKVDKTKFLNRIPSLDEIKRLIEVSENDRDKLVIEFLYVTGLRASEALSLTFRSFKKPQKGRVVFTVLGKGSKTRFGNIPIDLFERLKELDGYKLKAPLFRNLRRNCKESISYIALYDLLKKLSLKAKLGYVVSPHKFRHAHGAHALENGASLKEIKDRLGHSTLQTTEIYLESAKSELSEVSL
jgi:integrase/recombinase XerD